MRTLIVSVLCSLVFSAAVGCKSKIPEPEPLQPAAKKTEPSTSKPEPAAAATAAIPRAGWSEVSVENTLPLCVFADEREREQIEAVAQVKKQVLRPDQPVVFGVFAPRCISPDCEELAALQCSVERSGNMLRLQTSYRGFHKDGTTCRDQCRAARAGCASPVLESGEYTLEYGGTQIPLKIPSALNMPCFKRS
jgi:hypothetical protein